MMCIALTLHVLRTKDMVSPRAPRVSTWRAWWWLPGVSRVSAGALPILGCRGGTGRAGQLVVFLPSCAQDLRSDVLFLIFLLLSREFYLMISLQHCSCCSLWMAAVERENERSMLSSFFDTVSTRHWSERCFDLREIWHDFGRLMPDLMDVL